LVSKGLRYNFQMRVNENKPATPHNDNLDTTLSVKTVLKDLGLANLTPIFEREEVIKQMRAIFSA